MPQPRQQKNTPTTTLPTPSADLPLAPPNSQPNVPSQPPIIPNLGDGTSVNLNVNTIPQANGNISSDEIEKNEIDKIAQELRNRLQKSKPKDKTTVINHQPGVVEETKPNEDDTIYIDRDGTIHEATSKQATTPPPAEKT
jgi:hypothetical protein